MTPDERAALPFGNDRTPIDLAAVVARAEAADAYPGEDWTPVHESQADVPDLLDALDAETARAEAAEIDARQAWSAHVSRVSELALVDMRFAAMEAERNEARAALLDSERALADENDRAVRAEAALDRVRAVWQPHLDAVPLGLPCQCVGCQMGRAIDGVQPPHDGDETAGQDRRTTIDAITHDPCCSSHGKALTCAQYRRTHFVEVRPCCAHDARALDGAS